MGEKRLREKSKSLDVCSTLQMDEIEKMKRKRPRFPPKNKKMRMLKALPLKNKLRKEKQRPSNMKKSVGVTHLNRMTHLL